MVVLLIISAALSLIFTFGLFVLSGPYAYPPFAYKVVHSGFCVSIILWIISLAGVVIKYMGHL
jgi:hypothetical protein